MVVTVIKKYEIWYLFESQANGLIWSTWWWCDGL